MHGVGGRVFEERTYPYSNKANRFFVLRHLAMPREQYPGLDCVQEAPIPKWARIIKSRAKKRRNKRCRGFLWSQFSQERFASESSYARLNLANRTLKLLQRRGRHKDGYYLTTGSLQTIEVQAHGPESAFVHLHNVSIIYRTRANCSDEASSTQIPASQ